jgi:hypothetical protein
MKLVQYLKEAVVYVDKPDDTIRKIIQGTFPDYRGKKIQVVTGDFPTNLSSNWSGGSRNDYVFYNLANGKAKAVPESGTGFGKYPDTPKTDTTSMPDSVVLVKHTIFSGKDLGITIYAKPGAVAPLLPAPTDETLTKEEIFTMVLIRSLKSFARREEASRYGVSAKQYEDAVKSLQTKGYVSKVGGLSTDGKNYLASTKYARMDSMSAAKELDLKSKYGY